MAALKTEKSLFWPGAQVPGLPRRKVFLRFSNYYLKNDLMFLMTRFLTLVDDDG